MSKIVDWFEGEFLSVAKKRWTVWILLGVPAAWFLTKAYWQLTSAQTLGHSLFLLLCGLSLILFGILDRCVFPQRFCLWPGLFFGIVGIGCLVVFFVLGKPPSLPENKLVVAVARFTPASADEAVEADKLTYRIFKELEDIAKSGAPLIVATLAKNVPFEGDERARHRRAIESCGDSAHVVIWGDVYRHKGRLYVDSRLSVARPTPKVGLSSGTLGEFQTCEPELLDCNEEPADSVVQVTMFVYGIACYRAEKWDQAVGILGSVESTPAMAYLGLALLERAQRSSKPTEDLHRATESFGSFIERCADTTEREGARNNLGTAYWALAEVEDKAANCRRAIGAYAEALKVRTPDVFPMDYGMTQSNLGTAYQTLAEVEDKPANCRRAAKAYAAALKVYTEEEFPEIFKGISRNLTRLDEYCGEDVVREAMKGQ